MGKWFFRGKTIRWIGCGGAFAFLGLSVWDGADSAHSYFKATQQLENARKLTNEELQEARADRENSLWGIAIAISDLICASLLFTIVVGSVSISPWITTGLAALSVALIIIQYQRYQENTRSC